MLQDVIKLQSTAVKNIIQQIQIKDEITFKAPTGSGKTYMMADLMNQIIAVDKNIIFLVSSLSKGNLAEQNYENFFEYSTKNKFNNLNPYLITSETTGEHSTFIPTDYNVYVLPRDLYKNKSKLKQGTLVNFLRTITGAQPLGYEKKIYLIKDECHIATKNLDDLSKDYFTKIFNFSATPKLSRGQNPDVELSEFDAVQTHLIKHVKYENEKETLENALNKFKDIKKEYNDIGINPCMIIQISNKDKADDELKTIFQTLDNSKNKDLKWMLIVDKDKDCDTNDVFKVKKLPVDKWKNYAKKNTATIDIIIFKMVITEGWDIPRACMLYQMRDSKSKQLDEQVIGRVRRNPKLLEFEKLNKKQQELVSTAYVWGLVDSKMKKVQEVQLVSKDVQNEIKVKTTRLKNITSNKNFDLNQFIENQNKTVVPKSIFELYKKYNDSSQEVKNLCAEYLRDEKDIQNWIKFVEKIDEIQKKCNEIICDYEHNMELIKDELGNNIETSLPLNSYFTETDNFENITDWLWKRTDKSDVFSFDSEAEKEWMNILLSLRIEDNPLNTGRLIQDITIEENNDKTKKYLIGKNYLSNSEIKYEYFMDGEIHLSYPDFIMKDYKNQIHIFEVKSINKSSSIDIDEKEYCTKIDALKKCYKYAAKLTGYKFYIPIKDQNVWKIWYMHDDENLELISKEEFLKNMKGKE